MVAAEGRRRTKKVDGSKSLHADAVEYSQSKFGLLEDFQ